MGEDSSCNLEQKDSEYALLMDNMVKFYMNDYPFTAQEETIYEKKNFAYRDDVALVARML